MNPLLLIPIGGAIAAFFFAGGKGSEVTDAQRDALWNSLCAQWKNGATVPVAFAQAINAADLPDTDTMLETAAALWENIVQRSGGDRTVCPDPPWEGPLTTGELGPIKGITMLPQDDDDDDPFGGPKEPIFPPPPAGGGDSLDDVLSDFTNEAPGPGSLVQVTKQNGSQGMAGLSAAILSAAGAPNTNQNRVRIRKMVGLSKWNYPYRVPTDGSKYWSTFLDGVHFDIRAAFDPVNVNAQSSILQGKLPRRNVKWSQTIAKSGSGSSYGMLYIPEFQTFAGEVAAPSEDEDGVGMLPTALMNALGVTAADIGA